VKIWEHDNGSFKIKDLYDVGKVTNYLPGIRSVDINSNGKTLLIGTRGSEIYEFHSQE